MLYMDNFIIKPTTIRQYTQGVFIINDYLRYRWIIMGKTKGELAISIICLIKSLPLETQRFIQYIYSDDGREFAEVFEYAKFKYIGVSISAPYTPEENPIAKKIIGMVNIKVSVMLKQGGIPQFLVYYIL